MGMQWGEPPMTANQRLEHQITVYCVNCGLAVREEAAMQLRDGSHTHQGICYEQARQEAAKCPKRSILEHCCWNK